MKRAKGKGLGGESENYVTPAWPVYRLLDWLNERSILPWLGGSWIEPACGDGAIIKSISSWAAARSIADTIEWTGADIARADCAGVEPTNFFQDDFTKWSMSHLDGNVPFRVAITNPPFSLAEDFVASMLAIADVSILLLPDSWFAAKGEARTEILRHRPPALSLMVPDRIQFVDTKIKEKCPACDGSGKNYSAPEALDGAPKCKRCEGKGLVSASSPMTDHSWFVWHRWHVGATQRHILASTPIAERTWTLPRSPKNGRTKKERIAEEGRGENAGR